VERAKPRGLDVLAHNQSCSSDHNGTIRNFTFQIVRKLETLRRAKRDLYARTVMALRQDGAKRKRLSHT
jgi:hypothetical protein